MDSGMKTCDDCGKGMPVLDTHPVCVTCLGAAIHAQTALSIPGAWSHCEKLELRAVFFRTHLLEDKLSPYPASDRSPPDSSPRAQPPAGPPLVEHATRCTPHMSELEGSSTDASVKSCYADTMSLTVSLEGDYEQMAAEEEGADVRHEPARLSSELAVLLDRATQLLGIMWPAEPEWQGSLMDVSFYEHHPERQQRLLPAFPDFVDEVKRSWGKPYSMCSPVLGFGPFATLHGAKEMGLVKMPEVEEVLVAYVAYVAYVPLGARTTQVAYKVLPAYH